MGGCRDCGLRALEEKMHDLGLSLPRTGVFCRGARRVPALDTSRLVLSVSVPRRVGTFTGHSCQNEGGAGLIYI